MRAHQGVTGSCSKRTIWPDLALRPLVPLGQPELASLAVWCFDSPRAETWCGSWPHSGASPRRLSLSRCVAVGGSPVGSARPPCQEYESGLLSFRALTGRRPGGGVSPPPAARVNPVASGACLLLPRSTERKAAEAGSLRPRCQAEAPRVTLGCPVPNRWWPRGLWQVSCRPRKPAQRPVDWSSL